jgi:Leucine-rich repeat (LRR) protein
MNYLRVCNADPDQSEDEATRWLDGSNECEWFGLDCGDDIDPPDESVDAYYPVLNIDLRANNLAGPLISEIFEFAELRGLFMDGNMKISGTIPEALGQMQKLKLLDLDDNMLSGSLPNSLYTLLELIAIDLNSNQLIDQLSESIGDITNLEVLQLENNMMSGPLPSGGLLNLLRLGTCSFWNDIPESYRHHHNVLTTFLVSSLLQSL